MSRRCLELCSSGAPAPEWIRPHRDREVSPTGNSPFSACRRDRPRDMRKKTPPLHVGRGPVPRHAAIAGETRSDARVASEGPRATVKNGLLHRRAWALAGLHTRWQVSLASVRAFQRSRGTGPRATKKTSLRSVGPYEIIPARGQHPLD